MRLELAGHRALLDANLHVDRPATQFWIRATPGSAAVDVTAEALAERLFPFVPQLASVWAGDNAAGKELKRAEASDLAWLMASVALGLQREFDFPVAFRKVRPLGEPGLYLVAFEHRDPLLGALAGTAATSLVNEAAARHEHEARQPSLAAALTRIRSAFMQQAEAGLPATDTRRLILEAERRRIPWFRIHPQIDVLQFGWGHKQKRHWKMTTDRTARVQIALSTVKDAAAALMRSNGIPVPDHRRVLNVEAAVEAARAIGYPLAVKPTSSDRGVGVTIDVASEAALREAFERAKRDGDGTVLVERMVEGDYHRLTFVNFVLKAADKRTTPVITGDGTSTIRDLIAQVVTGKNELRLDADLISRLASFRYGPDDVLPRGETLALRDRWVPGTPNMLECVMTTIHPDNQRIAERAARLFNLDLVGIDFICPDITRSWREVGGAILEVNISCGLTNTYRAGNTAIYRDVLAGSFPDGDDGRIPLANVTGGSDAQAVVRLVGTMLERMGHKAGVADGDGARLNGEQLLSGSGAAARRSVLVDPAATAAVVHTDYRSVVRDGLGFDASAVSAVMGGSGDGTEWESAEAERQAVRRLHEVVVQTASETVILDADDPEIAGLAAAGRARRLAWVTARPETAMVREHVAAGGVAAVREPAPGSFSFYGSRAKFEFRTSIAEGAERTIMTAALVGHSLGVPVDTILDVLQSGLHRSAWQEARAPEAERRRAEGGG